MKKSVSLSLLAVACGSSGSSGPTSAEYDVAFPGLSVAVATDSVTVLVFDASVADCLTLVTKRTSQAELPPPLAQTPSASTCDLLARKAGTIANVGYGKRNFLAIAQRKGQDFFIGCAPTEVTEGMPPVEISVAVPAMTTIGVPATTCASLAAKCAGSCS